MLPLPATLLTCAVTLACLQGPGLPIRPQSQNASSTKIQARTQEGPAVEAHKTSAIGNLRSEAAGLRPDPARALREASTRTQLGLFAIYKVATSRRLFTACDLDGDDKLQFLEALRTLDTVSNPEDFRKLDANRDGVVRYDEFDRHFKLLTDAGAPLSVSKKAVERLPLGKSTPLHESPGILRFFAMLDLDSDDRISPEEWKAVGGVLDPKGTRFVELDTDVSGHLSTRELAPFEPLLARLEAPRGKRRHLRPLPESARPVDLDGSGKVDARELERALARVHPTLVRHAARILKQADRDRDGRLDAHELREALEHGPRKEGPKPLRLRR